MRCDIVQGYHIARPMPAIEFEKILATSIKLIA
jgi:EAL domain-containing protein (putative c-di-GMP-specific phosphodiesterase class I)